MSRIILITGGQRSGKSVVAETMALRLSDCPVYVATAHVYDEDFARRVAVHKARRGDKWTTIEEERYLSRHDVTGRVVLVDCCTLWMTNFWGEGVDDAEAVEQLEAEFDKLTSQEATFIFVTNETGLGGVSGNDVQRRFADMLGLFNQYVAAKADDVYLVVAGIPVKIKG